MIFPTSSVRSLVITFFLSLPVAVTAAEKDEPLDREVQRQILGAAMVTEDPRIREAMATLQSLDLVGRLHTLDPEDETLEEEARKALGILEAEAFLPLRVPGARSSVLDALSYMPREADGETATSTQTSGSDGSLASPPASGKGSAGGIGEEAAKQAAREYVKEKFPAWPKAFIQGVKLKGDEYIVTLIPESKSGMLLFFTTYRCYVDAGTGQVKRMK